VREQRAHFAFTAPAVPDTEPTGAFCGHGARQSEPALVSNMAYLDNLGEDIGDCPTGPIGATVGGPNPSIAARLFPMPLYSAQTIQAARKALPL